MTSKISFSKLLINDMKRRMWISVVLMVILILAMPLAVLFVIDRELVRVTQEIITRKELIDQITAWVGGSGGYGAIAIIAAIVSAFSGFRYLYAGKKVDIFHSIPVKREKLFLVQYVSGALLVLVPFLIGELLMLLVCGFKGFFMAKLWIAGWQGIGMLVVYYLLFYNVAIIAIMLTGKLLVGVLGMVTIWGYFPIVYAFVVGYSQLFLNSYYDGPTGQLVDNWLPYLSPLSLVVGMEAGTDVFQNWHGTEQASNELVLIFLLVSIVFIAATFVLGLWLYRMRKSETAGKAMAFDRSKPVIKVLLMVMISAGSGLFFIAFDNRINGLIVGLILGLAISQCLIEVIYSYDIKCALSHKKSLGVGAGCVVLFVAVFWLDIFGYDRFEPNKDEIAVLEISQGSFDSINNMDEEKFADIDFKDVPEMYELIRKAKETMEKSGSLSAQEDNEMYQIISFSVRYKMNNGKERYRNYWVNRDDITKELEYLYTQESFKRTQYAVMDRDEKDVTGIIVSDYNGDMEIRASVEERKELLKAFQQDIKNLKYQDILTTKPFGTINFEIKTSIVAPEYAARTSYNVDYYSMYPFYENTIKQLQDMGYQLKTEILLEDVTEIQVDRYDTWIEIDDSSDTLKTYSKPDQFKQIMDHCIDMDSYAYSDQMNNLVVIVHYRDDLGNMQEKHYQMKQDEIPDFVAADFGR